MTAPKHDNRYRAASRRSITRMLALSFGTTALVCAAFPLRAQTTGAVGAPPSAAATRPAAPGPDLHRLTVRATPATRPALQYRLLPDALERTPGNAAQVYLLAFLQSLQVPREV